MQNLILRPLAYETDGTKIVLNIFKIRRHYRFHLVLSTKNKLMKQTLFSSNINPFYLIFTGYKFYLPNPVVAWFKAWVCGCSLAGNAGSNPSGGMVVSPL